MEPRNIEEIINKGHVEHFRDEVTAIIHKLWKIGVSVCTTYIAEDTSKVEWDEHGKPERVRIKIKNAPEPPLNVIWDLLHEYGHIIDGYAGKVRDLPAEEQLVRERSAWHNAAKELRFYSRLSEWHNEFKIYEEKCLQTYRDHLLNEYEYSEVKH